MSTTEVFIKGLQAATGNVLFPEKFWGNYPEKATHTFQDALNKYADYYKTLHAEQQKHMSAIFWDQIKTLGTPIIEDDLLNNSKCDVYFLFPKDKISDSQEKPETKKDLYLQGDFHGYGVTDDRQRLSELSDTGIMRRKYTMPREAIVVYKYIQVEPSDKGITPKPELPPFFKKDNEEFIPVITNVAEFPAIPSQRDCTDDYSTHVSPFPGFEMPARIFCVNSDTKRAHIQSNPIKWPSLLNTKTPSDTKHFVYHGTLYSDQAGDLHRSEAKVKEQYHDDLYYSDRRDNSPYANFTRSIQVFKPASGKIDDIVVINDGIPYLMTGILDHFEKMVDENKLSPNTAFLFISPLPGLKKTLSKEEALAFDKDSLANTPGMGVRVIDYKDKIDQYTDFIADKLFPQLQAEISGVPDDPNHRIMIGSSLSGTASTYIGLKRSDLFGVVVAQSPSPANREILGNVPRTMLTERNIYLSCGEFEHPNYAAANANVEYAKELSRKLNVPLHISGHGHEFVAWNDDLERSLPVVLKESHIPSWQVDLINQISNAMNHYYCLPEKFRKKEQDFRQSLIEAFQEINHGISESDKKPSSKEEYQIYLDKINKTLGSFDPHLEITYEKDIILQSKNEKKIEINEQKNTAKFVWGSPPPHILIEMNQFRGRPEINYGFINTPTENTSIPEDIGYLKINFLLDPKLGENEKEKKYQVGPNAIKALNEAMGRMVGKKAIILDLRDAPEGGSPEMVQYIVSFFIKQKGMVINEIDDRLTGSRTSYKTVDTPHLLDVPVDILTDETTFSGHEELAYDLQQLNIQLQKEGKQIGDRFQVIGGVTRGGAHPTFLFPLINSSGKINEDIVLHIPYACSINPTSGTNWEDQDTKGVQPDQRIDKEKALKFSVEHLEKVISEKETQKIASTSQVSSQSIFSQPHESPGKVVAIDETKIHVLRKKGG